MMSRKASQSSTVKTMAVRPPISFASSARASSPGGWGVPALGRITPPRPRWCAARAYPRHDRGRVTSPVPANPPRPERTGTRASTWATRAPPSRSTSTATSSRACSARPQRRSTTCWRRGGTGGRETARARAKRMMRRAAGQDAEGCSELGCTQPTGTPARTCSHGRLRAEGPGCKSPGGPAMYRPAESSAL